MKIIEWYDVRSASVRDPGDGWRGYQRRSSTWKPFSWRASMSRLLLGPMRERGLGEVLRKRMRRDGGGCKSILILGSACNLQSIY